MLEKIIPLFRKPGILNPLLKLASSMQKMDLNRIKLREELQKNAPLLAARRRRVMDAITLEREPDRVPVIGNGVNFFPAKYAGITVAEFMYDIRKTRAAFFKMNGDFPLDMTFPSFLLAIGRLATCADLNLLKIPGRDIDKNSGYQYNETDRLKEEEYGEFLGRGMPFLVDTLAPRCAGIFQKRGAALLANETRLVLEAMNFVSGAGSILTEMEARGIYNIFGAFAFPPFDLVSIVFRTLGSVTKDLMHKQTREQVIELCLRMNPWLINLWTSLAKVTGLPGVWFTCERAFSLSPKQFEQFYWPTLKQMIIAFVNEGLIPFLTLESDVTHLVHFLLELPPRISRRCVFNCDTSDIEQVKKILDGHMCIAGNIPLSTMCVGTPHDVEKYCEKLFATIKPGGGFLLNPALGIPDEAKPENVHAMINYARKYGRYA
ncbi:MAG TPA: uroporphyrinogen decarboxylase family protein [Candidatus Lokiarchaeia archaeon]|nr:uroporphyrinogen decarboxylase family protein [Candidatus Lokiarchaeia archaeon]